MSFETVHLPEGARIVPSHQSEAWKEALSTFPAGDVYFSNDYHRLSEIDVQREAFLYFHQAAGHSLCFPFLSAPISQTVFPGRALYDFESCYGYTGPLATTSDPDIVNQLWEPFRDWCRKVGMVAGVTRFHPLLETNQFAAKETQQFLNREMIYIDLDRDEASLWSSYPAKQRNQIRQAGRNGLVARWAERNEIREKFVPIYLKAMEHAGAIDRYAFSNEYFDYLEKSFPDVELLLIEKETTPIAGALFLKGSDIYHYHLSGSMPDSRALRPNNLLLHEAALHAQRLGCKRFHLGGGRTTATDDALFKFKASFSPHTAKYIIGETIFLPEIHARLCDDWIARAGIVERPAALRFYRDPLPASASPVH